MADSHPRPRAPKGLGNTGRSTWRQILDDLDPELEFDARELAILRTACRQADLVTQLEQAVKKDGVMIQGAAGQRRLNATVTELRQSRLAFARLLGELGIPVDSGKPETAASQRARRAAHAKWGTQPGQPAEQGRLRSAT
jgi:phage terminase small subunit